MNLKADELIMVMIKQDPRATEEAVYVLRSGPSPQQPSYKLVHTRAKQPIDTEDQNVEAAYSESAIDPDMVQTLRRTWGRMVNNARWPNRDEAVRSIQRQTVGWGAPTYTFDYGEDMIYGQGMIAAPDRASCAASLVDLAELLIRFADERDPHRQAVIRGDFMLVAQTLARRLEQTHSGTQ